MPVYKQNPAFLKSAIQSVLHQTFRDFKLVIVLDGAPEMEAPVRENIGNDPRVILVSHEQNQGVAQALNTGFRELLQDPNIQYLTWVSTDNVYYAVFLEILRAALQKGPDELGLVYSSFQSMDDQGRAINDERMLAGQRQHQGRTKDHLLDSSIIGVSFMYKAKYARRIEGYQLVPVEDYDYWLRLTEHCEIKYIPVELMDYRVNSTFSVSATLQSVKQHRKWRYAYHLARHLARMRRHIDPSVSILYPVRRADDAVIARIENLYEQVFSNYFCYILDLSPDRQVTHVLSEISHPTTEFKWFPNHSENAALIIAAGPIQTPYTMVLGPESFPDLMDLQTLTTQLSKVSPDHNSCFYTDNHLDIGYRHPGILTSKTTIHNELFRTPSLNQILIRNARA